MVKFSRNRLKALNKLAKKQATPVINTTNKILKKRLNVEKRLQFQKEVLIKEAADDSSQLVNAVTAKKVLEDIQQSKVKKQKIKVKNEADEVKKPKLKPVEKQKKRRKTLAEDTKLLLKLMKKK